MGAAQLAARTGISIAAEVRGLWRPSNNEGALTRGGRAWKARVSHNLFGLRAVALAMCANQE